MFVPHGVDGVEHCQFYFGEGTMKSAQDDLGGKVGLKSRRCIVMGVGWRFVLICCGTGDEGWNLRKTWMKVIEVKKEHVT